MRDCVVRKSNEYFNSFTTKQEVFESASTLEIDKQGEMMNESRYIQWATTEKCPKLEHKVAQAQWDNWVSNPKASGMLTGMEGGLRTFRVPTKTMVNIKETLSQKKQVELEGKALKGKQITTDALSKLKASAMSGHNAPEELDFEGRASQMLQGSLGSSGATAFGEDGMLLGSITQLLGQDDDEEEGADVELGEEEDEEDDDAPAAEPPEKKPKYVNQGKLTLASTRELEKALDPKVVDLEEGEKKLREVISQIQKAPVTKQAWHKSEMAFAKPRLELAKACLHSTVALDKFRSDMAAASGPVSSGATATTHDAIEQAPPIPTLSALLSIGQLRSEIPGIVGKITTSEEKKTALKEFRTKLVPLSDLIKSVTDAVRTLTDRTKDFTTTKDSKKDAVTVPFLTACAEATEDTATATLDGIANLNPDRPALITGFSNLLNNEDITKGYAGWKTTWQRDVLTPGIGGRRTFEMHKTVEDAVEAFVAKEIVGKCPALRGQIAGASTVSEWAAELQSPLFDEKAMVFYGTTPAWETSTMEKHWLGSFRLSLEGPRSVAAYDFEAAHKFMLKLLQGASAGSALKKQPDLSPATIATTIRAWTKVLSMFNVRSMCVSYV